MAATAGNAPPRRGLVWIGMAAMARGEPGLGMAAVDGNGGDGIGVDGIGSAWQQRNPKGRNGEARTGRARTGSLG